MVSGVTIVAIIADELASERLALGGETAALGVGESEPRALELAPQNAVLLAEVVDRSSYVFVHEPGEGGKQEMERL